MLGDAERCRRLRLRLRDLLRGRFCSSRITVWMRYAELCIIPHPYICIAACCCSSGDTTCATVFTGNWGMAGGWGMPLLLAPPVSAASSGSHSGVLGATISLSTCPPAAGMRPPNLAALWWSGKGKARPSLWAFQLSCKKHIAMHASMFEQVCKAC